MRFALVLGIVSVGLLLSATSAEVKDGGNLEALVQSAIQNATIAYDERVRLSFLGGAQSKRKHREVLKSTPYSKEVGRLYNIHKNAMYTLISSHGLDHPVALKLIQAALPKQCEFPNAQCDPDAKYRTADGTCNNLANPHWGAVNAPNARLIRHAYETETSDEPRGGRLHTGLPSARHLSLQVHQGPVDFDEIKATHMVAQFGQFLDHDFTITPVDNSPCCDDPNSDDNCWAMPVSDQHYQDLGIACLDFVRSTATCLPTSLLRREQINAITAYIDASMVYGSSAELTAQLRSHQGGRLIENVEHPGFLPWASQIIEGATGTNVYAGDVRANEMPGLTAMHALFLREHNRIADQFAQETSWSDEEIFQETKRIIAAELQQITYTELLPAILGHQAMVDYKLQLPKVTVNSGYTTYNANMDATIISSFATAAYRFGHTLVRGLIKLMLDTHNQLGEYHVRDNYLISDEVIKIHPGFVGTGYDLILKGLITDVAQGADAEIHSDMANDLFMNRATNIGTDLAARNIQRGRDHGLPSYNDFRALCRLSELTTSWADIPSEFTPAAWNRMKDAYEPSGASPLDIDLYTGGLSEELVEGALSGPTFVCIQGAQFRRLMEGDRFFFTHSNVPGTFTPDQLLFLRSRTLGDIICQNSVVKDTQQNVFYVQDAIYNPMIPCDHPSRQLNIVPFTFQYDILSGASSYLPISFAITLLLSLLATLF